jgi:flagellar biosynthesis protein FlhB
MSKPVTINLGDIMLIVMGVGMLLLAGLIATIYTGVAGMTARMFENITEQPVPDYASQVATFVPLILNMLGLTLIIVAVAHIIATLISTLKGPVSQAGVITG